MPRFRKKPVEIEARRWPGGESDAAPIVEWIGGEARWQAGKPPRVIQHIVIPTLEGTMRAAPGDWIIRGVQGEFYPCKPDIFAETYEPAPVRVPEDGAEGAEAFIGLASALNKAMPSDEPWRSYSTCGRCDAEFPTDESATHECDPAKVHPPRCPLCRRDFAPPAGEVRVPVEARDHAPHPSKSDGLNPPPAPVSEEPVGGFAFGDRVCNKQGDYWTGVVTGFRDGAVEVEFSAGGRGRFAPVHLACIDRPESEPKAEEDSDA